MRSFFGELKKRRVYRAAIAYVVAASAFVQISSSVLPTFHVADWIQQFVLVVLALGFPVALVLSYIFEFTDGELRRTVSNGGHRSVENRRRIFILAFVGLAFAATVIAAYFIWRPAAGAEARAETAPPLPGAPIPEKSVAVLPFANLSEE